MISIKKAIRFINTYDTIISTDFKWLPICKILCETNTYTSTWSNSGSIINEIKYQDASADCIWIELFTWNNELKLKLTISDGGVLTGFVKTTRCTYIITLTKMSGDVHDLIMQSAKSIALREIEDERQRELEFRIQQRSIQIINRK